MPCRREGHKVIRHWRSAQWAAILDAMTTRWIVGVDGSEPSVDALRWAAEHAGSRGAELVAVSVFHVPPVMALFTAKRGLGVDELGLAATAGHELDVAIERVGPSVPVTPLVVEGSTGPELVRSADDADALVVGQTGGGDERFPRLGSVARYCATHARVPVVVVPAGRSTHPVSRVVVGFDGSANAEAALRWALEFSSPEVSVRVVCAIEVVPWLGERVTRERFPEEVTAEESALRARIDTIDTTRRAEVMFLLDAPRRALEVTGRDADLIVVGARGRGVIAAGLLGSVSTSLLHGHVAVAIVPEQD
jgi:nucleotide-binding universal stress UspA family protein